ncbi:DUF411 domain-containing protein [Paracoccus sp. MC1862]|uniref:DUF411 domain-containing protein n=1 Tax=Paracoccus sp. MC1862 TaxID=2760307 RepID=UPI0015FFD7A4|nr:DUF411 domain-containing protein [Paracoccus sp. MC1862]MBB1497481.1 DUF411 domain-containing protein [Paracoccus sp. MC1862]QQO45955.1 DUF411 domain-containing protein [Paracoccus sp. MC1862]
MTQSIISRRKLLVAGGALALAGFAAPLRAGKPALHVLKDPDCGCCTAWVDTLRAEGLEATVEVVSLAQLHRVKREGGIPAELSSCHTAEVEGYLIEGHVPARDILRLLDARPDAIGLTVPGMPWGSPGMGPESEREAYDVLLIRRDGGTEVFAHYAAA